MLLCYECSWLVVPPSSPALCFWGTDLAATSVLVVCSACQGISVESTSWSIFWCKWLRSWHLSHSWFVPVVLSCQVALQTCFIFFSDSPSFPHFFYWLVHLNLVCVLFPHVLFLGFSTIHLPPSFLSLTRSCLPRALPIPLFWWLLPTFSSSFHPMMHCLFLGTNLTRFVFSQTFRAPPASRPRTATN